VTGFGAGQTINIDSGANFETAVVVSTRAFRAGVPGRAAVEAAITVTAPLRYAHAAGVEVSGSGITLTSALTRAHAGGAQVTTSVPTPGAPNRYFRSSRRDRRDF
jgi:hypothetical protein